MKTSTALALVLPFAPILNSLGTTDAAPVPARMKAVVVHEYSGPKR
ncbi:MAG TPA: hypothetical protein VGL24_02230 [Chthoniobacterales bacterium]